MKSNGTSQTSIARWWVTNSRELVLARFHPPYYVRRRRLFSCRYNKIRAVGQFPQAHQPLETSAAMPSSASIAPIVHRFESPPSVEHALLALEKLDGVLLLHSATQTKGGSNQPLDRYSFLMADPFDTIGPTADAEVDDATLLLQLREILRKFQTPTVAGLPPMQGGVAGMFSYELNQAFESVPISARNSLPVPALMLGVYDCVIAWDHHEKTCQIISQGFPETDMLKRAARAQHRIDFFLAQLNSFDANERVTAAVSQAPEPLDDSSMRLPVAGPAGLTSNFSRDDYIEAVRKIVDYIFAGDVYQINLAQQLRLPANCTSTELFLRLCQCNPAPFGGYYHFSAPGFAPTAIVSASPERLISVRDSVVETRPIKGTRPRTGRPMVDIYAREDLLSSGKDIAENTMIVDLMRNDLSRVCDDDSVVVPQLCELEEYASVLHLVSSVEGRLRPQCDLVDLIAAIFPGGSITGAPKVRAMEIIAELETEARGAYCGSLGYLGFDGNADLNILIRTVTAQRGWWQIPVGGGIVSQSVPVSEYEETWTKAAGMLRAASMNNVSTDEFTQSKPVTSRAGVKPDRGSAN